MALQFGSNASEQASAVPHLNGRTPLASTSSSSSSHSRGASSSVPPQTPRYPPPVDSYSDVGNLTAHLTRSFVSAEFSDVKLICAYGGGGGGDGDGNGNENGGSTIEFNVHSVIISQSPTLRALLTSAYSPSSHPTLLNLSLPPFPPQPTASTSAASSSLTTPAATLNLCLAWLYSPSSVFAHLSPLNAPSTLFVSSFLGLESLAARSADICVQAIREARDADEIERWLGFLTSPFPSPTFSHLSSPPNSTPTTPSSLPNGTPSKPNGVLSSPTTSTTSSSHHHQPMFSYYISVLLRELMERVTVRLPIELGAFGTGNGASAAGGSGGQVAFIELLKGWPFGFFKQVLESSRLPVSSDMDRFNFAKRCVAERKKLFTASVGTSGGEFEESVALSFGTTEPGASSVNVFKRRVRKS